MQAKFNDLPRDKKQKFIGELMHAIQNDDTFFHYAEIMIGMAKRRGIFDKVKILTEAEFVKNKMIEL